MAHVDIGSHGKEQIMNGEVCKERIAGLRIWHWLNVARIRYYRRIGNPTRQERGKTMPTNITPTTPRIEPRLVADVTWTTHGREYRATVGDSTLVVRCRTGKPYAGYINGDHVMDGDSIIPLCGELIAVARRVAS